MTEVANISLLHRLPTGVKLFILFIVSIALFFIHNPFIMTGIALIIALLYPLGSFPLSKSFQVLRPLFIFILAIALFQFFTGGWPAALLVSMRLIALVLLAALITLTTTTSQMLEIFERLFQPLKLFGLNPTKISLTIALALRFIPVFQKILHEVREAQKARGLEKSVLALIIPATIRMFKMSDDIAAAIDARGYDASILVRREL